MRISHNVRRVESDRMTSALDPVTLEVIRNALPTVANEMAARINPTSDAIHPCSQDGCAGQARA